MNWNRLFCTAHIGFILQRFIHFLKQVNLVDQEQLSENANTNVIKY